MKGARRRGAVCALIWALAAWGAWAAEKQAVSVETAYPDLASGFLASATLGALPPGVLVQAGSVQVTTKDLGDLIAKAPALRAQLEKNAFYMAEELTAQRVLILMAKSAATQAGKGTAGKSDRDLVDDYLMGVAAQVTVTDAEVQEYYNAQRAAFGNAPLSQVGAGIRQLLLKEKRDVALAQHVRDLGKAIVSVVSAPWALQQAILAKDNPVDRARASGRPTLVEFSKKGDAESAKVAPVIAAVQAKHAGKLNVVSLDLGDEPILAARYGVLTAPTQLFFDKDGKAVERHTGSLSQEELEGALKELGAD